MARMMIKTEKRSTLKSGVFFERQNFFIVKPLWRLEWPVHVNWNKVIGAIHRQKGSV